MDATTPARVSLEYENFRGKRYLGSCRIFYSPRETLRPAAKEVARGKRHVWNVMLRAHALQLALPH